MSFPYPFTTCGVSLRHSPHNTTRYGHIRLLFTEKQAYPKSAPAKNKRLSWRRNSRKDLSKLRIKKTFTPILVEKKFGNAISGYSFLFLKEPCREGLGGLIRFLDSYIFQ
jgi:hypothetical protein